MSNEIQKLLAEHFGENTPDAFLHANVSDLLQIKGLGKVKANLIFAVKEYCNYLYQNEMPERYKIRSPEDAANYMMNKMRFLQQEHFVCLYLNVKNEVLAEETIFIGSLNSSIVHPREIFKPAFNVSAASIICFHNHPSGDPSPSQEDIDVTNRLVETGRIIGFDIMDHIIIGDKKFVSMADKGYIMKRK